MQKWSSPLSQRWGWWNRTMWRKSWAVWPPSHPGRRLWSAWSDVGGGPRRSPHTDLLLLFLLPVATLQLVKINTWEELSPDSDQTIAVVVQVGPDGRSTAVLRSVSRYCWRDFQCWPATAPDQAVSRLKAGTCCVKKRVVSNLRRYCTLLYSVRHFSSRNGIRLTTFGIVHRHLRSSWLSMERES